MKDNYYNFKYTFSTLNNVGRVSVFADDIESAREKARAALGNSTASLTIYKIKALNNTFNGYRG